MQSILLIQLPESIAPVKIKLKFIKFIAYKSRLKSTLPWFWSHTLPKELKGAWNRFKWISLKTSLHHTEKATNQIQEVNLSTNYQIGKNPTWYWSFNSKINYGYSLRLWNEINKNIYKQNGHITFEWII